MKLRELLHEILESARRIAHIEQAVSVLTTQGATLMSDIQDVLDTLDQIKAATGTYIAGRDAIDATLNATIADLTAKLAAGATPADVQAGIDAALQKAKDDLALLTPPAVAPVEPPPDAPPADVPPADVPADPAP